MPPVNVEQLRDRLGWADVRDEAMPEYQMRCFRAVPRDESLPSVDLYFDDSAESLEQLSSGDWHCHPGDWYNPPEDINCAIDLARKLIHHDMSILEARDRNGKLSSSGPVASDEVPGTLSLDADHFVRRFFGVPAVREAIDFSRYAKGKHLYIELKRKAESDALWQALGKSPPEF